MTVIGNTTVDAIASDLTRVTGHGETVDEQHDSVAAYYDLLAEAQGSAALPSVAFFASHARPTHRVLDVGAGTGRIALAIAERGNHVYCLEPSAAMRAVLLAKLAGKPSLRDRVTVMPGAAPTFQLPNLFDYAYLAGVVQYLPGDSRPQLFDTLTRHLRPGAILAIDMIGGRPGTGWPARPVADIAVGDGNYSLHCAATPDGPTALRMRLVYCTALRDQFVTKTTVERVRHFHPALDTMVDLRAAGFVITGGSATHPDGDTDTPADGGTLIAEFRRRSPQRRPQRDNDEHHR
jgi:SAM-dependent methyltransferase